VSDGNIEPFGGKVFQNVGEFLPGLVVSCFNLQSHDC
jgi:hypothetical protein